MFSNSVSFSSIKSLEGSSRINPKFSEHISLDCKPLVFIEFDEFIDVLYVQLKMTI